MFGQVARDASFHAVGARQVVAKRVSSTVTELKEIPTSTATYELVPAQGDSIICFDAPWIVNTVVYFNIDTSHAKIGDKVTLMFGYDSEQSTYESARPRVHMGSGFYVTAFQNHQPNFNSPVPTRNVHVCIFDGLYWVLDITYD